MYWILDIALVLCGYVIAIPTWPKLKLFVNGATLEAQRLRDKAKALETAIRG